MHDLCYAAGYDQQLCDDQFRENLIAATGDSVQAGIMYTAVSAWPSSSAVNWGKQNCCLVRST